MTLRANQIAGLAAAIAHVRPLERPADQLLHQFFRQHPAMGQQDRAFVADGVFAYLRRRRSLEELAQTTHPSHLALAVTVRELGIGIREMETALKAADIVWLRAFKSRLATSLPGAVAADLPDWLWTRLGAAFGEIERAREWGEAMGHMIVGMSRACGSCGVGHCRGADAAVSARVAGLRPAIACTASVVHQRRARGTG